jgi:hypothetical protein
MGLCLEESEQLRNAMRELSRILGKHSAIKSSGVVSRDSFEGIQEHHLLVSDLFTLAQPALVGKFLQDCTYPVLEFITE